MSRRRRLPSGSGSSDSTGRSGTATTLAARCRDRSYEEPFRTLYRRLLEVRANCPHFMHMPESGPCSYEPNPWHADPPDPELIGAGTNELLDRIGAAAGVGSRPTP